MCAWSDLILSWALLPALVDHELVIPSSLPRSEWKEKSGTRLQIAIATLERPNFALGLEQPQKDYPEQAAAGP